MNVKNTKKLPIHENADANITCDFGDGDISRLGVANQTNVYIHNYLYYIKICLGVVQNCQHCKEHTLFCDPLTPDQKSTLKMLILRPLLKIAIHHQGHFKKRVQRSLTHLLPVYAVYARENDDNSERPLAYLAADRH